MNNPTPQQTFPKISSLFRESWARYKPLWKQLALITIVFYCLTVLIEVALAVLGIGGIGLTGLALFADSSFNWNGMLGLAALAALVFVQLLLASWLQATLLLSIQENNVGTPFSELARKGRTLTNRVFGATLLSVFLILLGLLFLLLPGIYLAVAFAFATPVAVFEGLGGGAALRRSRELVKGQWWNVFVALVAIGFVLGLATLGLDGLAKQLGGSSLESIISILSGIIATPFGAIYTYLLYKHLATK